MLAARVSLLACLALLAGAPAHAGPGRNEFSFFSPSRNIGCQMLASGSSPHVYCQTRTPQRSVTLYPRGLMVRHTYIGNAGEGTGVLGYGRSAAVGVFRCTSL